MEVLQEARDKLKYHYYSHNNKINQNLVSNEFIRDKLPPKKKAL